MEVNKTNNLANLESELNFAPLDLPKDTNNLISTIVSDVNKHKITPAIEHSQLYEEILKEIKPIDFKSIVFPKLKDYEEHLKGLEVDSPDYKKVKELIKKCKLQPKHFVMVTIDELKKHINRNHFGLSKHNGNIYAYNGNFWQKVEKEEFQNFLKNVALKFGVEKYDAKYHRTIDELHKQFLADSYYKAPQQDANKVLINLKNGTFELSGKKKFLRDFNQNDFLTYQLNFNYDKDAKSPLFNNYLDKVLPNKDVQKLLAEYIGSIFLKNGNSLLKIEKVMLLYGSGANGKSVFYEVITALIGKENITSYSLQSLTNETGYQRAKLENVLLNYAPEISSKMNPTIFKQLASGEEVEARLPYGEPFIMSNYAKFLFNCNELPKETEQTKGYFRRFIIVPFNVTIPEEEQDKSLHTKIIDNELSGILNWALEGLERLIEQQGFTQVDEVNEMLKQFKLESDSVAMFIDEGYTKSTKGHYLVSDLYKNYREFCSSSGFVSLNQKNFKRRLEALSIEIRRTSSGNMVYVESTMINDF
ncbi:phage/plasmid primase, P4 family [Empedobacter falsenii]